MAKERLANLNIIRGMAATMVFFFHARLFFGTGAFNDSEISGLSLPLKKWAFSLTPFNYGASGVQLFIFLSGFLLHYLYHERLIVKQFLIRRFFRIYPIFFVILFLSVSLNFASFDSWDFIFHSLLINNLFEDYFFTIGPHLWTIPLECQLYISYIILLKFGMHSTTKFYYFLYGSIVLALFTSAYGFWFNFTSPVLSNSIAIYLSVFLLGAEISIRFREGRLLIVNGWVVTVISILLFININDVPGSFLIVVLSIFYYFGLSWFLSKRIDTENMFWNFWEFVGKVSYSFYLIHVLTLKVTPHIHFFNLTNISSLFSILDIVLVYFITLAISYSMYSFFEKPSIALGKKFE